MEQFTRHKFYADTVDGVYWFEAFDVQARVTPFGTYFVVEVGTQERNGKFYAYGQDVVATPEEALHIVNRHVQNF